MQSENQDRFSSDTHICLHPHAAEPTYIPSPFLKNQYRQPARGPSQCWQYWQCWRSHLHVYFLDPPIHHFVNKNRWILPSLLCWNLSLFRYNMHVPFFRKKCPWLLTKWISLTFFANADWSMGEAIFSFVSSSLPNSPKHSFLEQNDSFAIRGA